MDSSLQHDQQITISLHLQASLDADAESVAACIPIHIWLSSDDICCPPPPISRQVSFSPPELLSDAAEVGNLNATSSRPSILNELSLAHTGVKSLPHMDIEARRSIRPAHKREDRDAKG